MAKPPKKKGHAIAVFSSKTYILASDNTEKKKKESTDEKDKDLFNVFESQLPKSPKNDNSSQKIIKRSEKMKDTVANWLKSVTGLSDSSSKHQGEQIVSEISDKSRHENEKAAANKNKKVDEILKNGDFENQRKNSNDSPDCMKTSQTFRLSQLTMPLAVVKEEISRMSSSNQEIESVKETENEKSSCFNKESAKLLKTSCGDFRWPLKNKTCYLTSSGRLFTLKQKPETVETMNLMLESENAFQPLNKVPGKVFSNVIRQSISSSSVPSVIVAKERIKRMIKSERKKDRGRNFGESRSKSMEVVSLNSNASDQRKNSAKPLKKKHTLEDKRSKESKNEMVKKEVEESLNNFKRKVDKKNMPTNLSSNSELLGTINLEGNKWLENQSPVLKEDLSNKIQLYSVTTLSGNDFRYSSPADKFVWMVRHAEQKDKETEKGKRNERNSESKGTHAAPKTPKSSKKENFVESKKSKKSKNPPKSKDLVNHEQNYLKNVVNCQELHTPLQSECSSNENYAEFNYQVKDISRFKKFNWKEDPHSEDKSTNKIQSESEESKESLIKNKRSKKNKKYKANASETKTEEETCIMGTFFKNLRGLYPKIGKIKDVPWLGYCDKECKKRKHLEKLRKEKEQQEKKLNKENNKLLKSQAAKKQQLYYDHFDPRKDENNDEVHMEHLKKCKCVQVYMQSQNNQDWPGSRPLKPLDEKISSPSGSESEGDYKTAEYYVGYSTEGEKKAKKKSSHHKHKDHEKVKKEKKHPKEHHHHQKKSKEEKPRKEKHSKKEKHVKTKKHRDRSEEKVKKGKHKKKEKKNKCVCDKCGNVHRKKKPKKSKKRKDDCDKKCEKTPSKTSENEEEKAPVKEEEPKEEEPVVEEDRHDEDEEEPQPHHKPEKCQKPYLAFLKGFCSKPSKQSKSYLATKFNELRYLKACPKMKNKKCVKKDRSESSISESQSFSTKEKQVDFEDTKSTDNTPKTDNTSESEPVRESETNVSDKCYCKIKLDDIEGRLRSLEGHKKKKRKKSPSEKRGKKEKKRKHPRSSSSGSQGKKKKKKSCINCKKKKKKPKDSSAAYFCTCLPSNSPFATNSIPKTNVVVNHMRYCCDKAEGNKTNKGTKLKGRLSSFQFMWKSFRKHMKKKGEGDYIENLDDGSTDGLLDDCSRSSPVPKKRAIFSLKNEPSNIFSKQKKKKTKKKERESKHKSKSKSKRHKSR